LDGPLIEQFWPFEEISIFSNGGHLGYRTALTDTNLKGTHPGTIPTRFGLIWFSGFRGENLNVIYHWANCNETLVEWSLDGPLPNLCPVIPTSNQNGCQAKNRKKGG
jgi:hypothetical protein